MVEGAEREEEGGIVFIFDNRQFPFLINDSESK